MHKLRLQSALANSQTSSTPSRSRSASQRRRNQRRRPLQLEALERRLVLSTVRLDVPEAATGDVTEFDVSPDGRFAVYVADTIDDNQFEIYSVELASGDVRQLNADVAESSVAEFEISADSRRVVYRSQNLEDVFELYSVPLLGGPSTRLDAALSDEGSVHSPTSGKSFAISPNASRVAYIADQDADEVFELFSVPISGGAPTKLNGELVPNGNIWQFQISADSQHLVYRANQDDSRTIELYSVALDGGEPVKINSPLPSYRVVDEFQISADGSWVVYLADPFGHEQFEVFSAPITGGTVNLLNGDLKSDEVESFVITPDSDRVLYRAAQDSKSIELYSVSIAGGDQFKLNAPLEQHDDVLSFWVSPDGRWTIYMASHGNPRHQLFRVATTGGDFTNISNNELVVFSDVQFSPDSAYAVFQVASSLYSAPLDGGEANDLSTLASGEVVAAKSGQYRVTPDGTRVVYLANSHVGERRYASGIFSAPIGGGNVIQLNDPLVLGGRVSEFAVSMEGDRVAYLADQEVLGVSELYWVETAGGAVDKLSRPIVAIGDSVSNALFSPDGQHVVYRANQEDDHRFDLFRAATSSGESTKLVTGSVDSDFQISPDGQRVVYRTHTLRSVPLMGGESIRLTDADFSRVYEFQISPDGARVVFRATPLWPSDDGLYSVPITGGVLTKLNVGGSRDVESFRVTPDGKHVVYQEAGHLELFSVPIAGGEPKRLESPLRGRLVDFHISADSQWVVYQTTTGVGDLYSVPITGTGLTRLNKRPLPAAELAKTGPDIVAQRGSVDGVLDYAVSPDGRYVVYVADEENIQREEVFSVPIGGGPSTKLNDFDIRLLPWFEISPDSKWVVFGDYWWRTPELVSNLHSVPITGGDVVQLGDPLLSRVSRDIQIGADSNVVVYHSDGQLFSVPLAGGPSIPLNGELPAGGQVESDFSIAPDGNTVVYRADQDADKVIELYRTPIDGGGGPWKLNDPLVAGGDVGEFEFSAEGSHLIYLADQDLNRQTGLHLTPLRPFRDLQVTSFVPDGSGFVVEFNEALDADLLNLYATGPADVVLQGAVAGPISGSFVVDPSMRGGRFVKSGGPLPSDIYTLRLRAGREGFQSEGGAWLDGDGDGLVGDDFSASFIQSAFNRVIQMPDFVSAPGETVGLPGARAGLPLTISDGTGVRNAVIQVDYDPVLLSITGATLGSTMPAGAEVTFETTGTGTGVITFNSPVDLTPGEHVLLHLQATVPADDPERIYGRHQIVSLQVISLTDVEGQPLSVLADHGVHVAALRGDVSGNGRVNAVDASRVARVVAGFESGFEGSPLLDPRITADISGNGILNAVDAVRLLWIPLGGPPTSGSSPEVTLSIDRDTISESARLTLNQKVAGQVAIAGEEDVYTFALDGNERLYFDALTSHPDIDWTLTGPAGIAVDGRPLTSDALEQDESVLALPAGQYELTLDAKGDATGSYAFQLLVLGEAAPLVPGTPVADELSPDGEANLYQFTASPGDQLFFDSLTDLADVHWQLFDPVGEALFSRQFSEDQENLILRRAGVYTLLVDGRHDSVDPLPYSFNAQPVHESWTAVATSGEIVSGAIERAGERDHYEFSLTADTRIYLDTLNDNPSVTWTLTGPGGVFVDAQPFTDSTPVLDLGIGSYSVVIDAVGDLTTPYQFRLVEVNSGAALVPGTQVRGTLTPPSATDFYRFTASAGDHFYFDAETGPSNARWRVIDPYNNVLFSQPLTDDQDTLTLVSSGEYTVLIEGGTAAELTDYSFTIRPMDLTTTTSINTTGEIVSGSISVPHEIDFYEFHLESRTVLYVDSLTDDESLLWTLRAPFLFANRLFNSTDGPTRSFVAFDVPPGPYSLTVEGRDGASGDYAFRVLDAQRGQRLENGVPVSATLAPKTTDVYRFDVAPGDVISLKGEPATAPLTWRLVDPRHDHANLEDFATQNGTIGFGAKAGTWMVLIESPINEESPIDYTFTATKVRNTPPFPITAEELTIGTTVSGTISNSGQRDTYKLNLDSHPGLLYVDALRENHGLSLTVGQPGYAGRRHAFSDVFLLRLSPGEHTFQVGSNRGGTGDYSFRLLDRNAATAIVPGETIRGSFDPGGEMDLYSFTATAGDKFFLDVRQGNQVASWQLRDPFGTHVSTNAFNVDHETQTLSHSGEYLLMVGGRSLDTPTDYEFAVQRVVEDLEPLSVNELVSGTIDEAGNIDSYHFELDVPSRLYFDALTTHGEQLWTLTGPAGVEVLDRSFSASDSFAVDQPVLDLVPGSYTLTVDAPGDSVGDYQFRLRDLSSAEPIVPGVLTVGELPSPRETNLYRFDATAGDQFFFDMQFGSSDAIWRVVDPFDNVLFSAPANTDQDTLTLRDSGTYTVLVEGNPQAQIASNYAFTIFPINNTPADLTLGAATSGAIDTPGDRDTYQFSLEEPARVHFDALVSAPALNWSLMGPGGLEIKRGAFVGSDPSDPNPISMLDPGTYEIDIYGDGDSVGAYSFQVLDLAAATPIVPSTPVGGELETHAAILYRLSALQGDRFYFDALTGNIGALWSLIDPFDRVIAAAQFGTDLDSLTSAVAGEYAVLVQQTSGVSPYQFVVEPVQDVRFSLDLDTTVAETIGGPGEQHHYEFVLNSEDRLHFDSLTNHASFNWTLAGPAGTAVSRRSFTQSDSFDSGEPVLDVVPGRYRLTVDAAGDTTGDYSFRLRSLASGTTLVPGLAIEGILDPANESDIYRFEAAAGDQFSFSTVTDVVEANWVLVDPFNNVLFSSVFQTVPEPVTIKQAGQYSLLISGRVSATEAAAYRFDVQHLGNDPPEPLVGEPLPDNPVRGTLPTSDSEVHYRFSLADQARMIFDAQSADGDFHWSLVGPAGELVQSRPFSASEQLAPVIDLAAGDYQLSVSAAEGANGDYQFSLRDVESALPFRPGATVAGRLEPASATQPYQFEAVAGDRFFFDIHTGIQDATWTLVDPYSNVIFTAPFGTDRDTLALTQSGTYTILIEGQYGAVDAADFLFRVQPVRAEGDLATLTATLSHAVGVPVTVDLGLTGTALSMVDFVASDTEILIPPGSLSGSVTLTALRDQVDESPETIVVDIVAVDNGVERGVQRQTVRVTDERIARDLDAAGIDTLMAHLELADVFDPGLR